MTNLNKNWELINSGAGIQNQFATVVNFQGENGFYLEVEKLPHIVINSNLYGLYLRNRMRYPEEKAKLFPGNTLEIMDTLYHDWN